LAVIPCRNATKLDVGNPPRRYDIALCLKEMNRVWHYEPADLTVSVEPGMKFGDFLHYVGRHGLWLPLDPAGGARASLGGIVATNSTGPLRLLYGAPRDMVIGMKIATTEGKVVKTGGRVVKNVAGYDLAKLLIGSYGTLGVIVEVSFKLFPLPVQRGTFVIPVGTLGIGRDIRRRILHSPLEPMRMVLLDAAAATLVRKETSLAAEKAKEPEIWIEFGGSQRVLERCARELGELGRAAGAPARQLEVGNADALWARISDFRDGLLKDHPQAVILKAILPDTATEEFLSRAQQEAESERIQTACISQLGVGIVHLGLRGESPSMPALIGRLRGAAEGLGGKLVVETCAAEFKNQLDVWGATGDAFGIMSKLKAAWDPKGILSPGRFVGGL
ncbi:MAG: FAD-binding oxidoreductase, partial [Acidobacteria bacterium]|nr:FAD-binding oxidoreductase [Acidobacteriota bacterium]